MRAYAHYILYRFFDKDKNLLYVGITNDVRVRMDQHSGAKDWYDEVASATYEHHKNRRELEHAEWLAIQNEKPKYNIKHSALPPALVMKRRTSKAAGRRLSGGSRFPAPDSIVNRPHDDLFRDLLERELVNRKLKERHREGFIRDMTMLHERLGVPEWMRDYRLRKALEQFDADQLERVREAAADVG